jgi:hypothetical protein
VSIVQQLPGFDYPPFLIPQADGTTFALWEEVVYTGSQGDSWVIPEGFKTDFATIPAAVSWAIPKMGAYTLAAIVHDLLCEGLNDWHRLVTKVGVGEECWPDGQVRYLSGHGDVVTPPAANAVDTDAIFRKIARDYGVDPVTAALLWVGVRWGALANPARREGWLRTAPAVLGLSLLFAPVLLPATVLAVGGRLALRAARRVGRWFS